MIQDSRKTILLFGVFDMLHPGHVYFIDQAISLLGELHVNLATDEYVKQHKNKSPIHSYEERQNTLKHMYPEIIIHKGDNELGPWTIFKTIQPNLIVLGYDQDKLREAILESGLINDVEFITVSAHMPEKYSTTNLSI